MAVRDSTRPNDYGNEEAQPPKCIKNLRWYFMEYCNNTTIHGFKYLGERRSSIEKIWWAIVLVTSFYFCIMMIIETYKKWERSPVIVSFATSETPIWQIPFPAVTICPRTKSIKSMFNFTEMALMEINEMDANAKNAEKLRNFEYMSLVCSSKLHLFTDNESTISIDSGIIDFLMKVQPDFSSTVVNCTWAEQPCLHKVEKIFKPTITSDGVCYSYNMLDRDEIYTSEMDKGYYERFSIAHQPQSEWSIEDGYEKDAGLTAFPNRTVISGSIGGLDLTLMTLEVDLDYLCGDAIQGYDVILHHPAQVPSAKESIFRVGLNQDVAANIKPNMMKTSASLKDYSSKNRNCYFMDDRKLRFFSVYNQHDCLIECLANYTLKYCGCVGFYMPRNRETPICGRKMHWCINVAITKFLTKEVTFKLEHPDYQLLENATEENLGSSCNCLQSCDSLNFDAIISQSEWDWRKGRQIVASKNESERFHLSRLRIYFKDMQFITSERDELYGSTDFLANCGGLLGLFMGFSLMSLVEIVYFVTLRFACNFRKHGRHYWSGAEELMEN